MVIISTAPSRITETSFLCTSLVSSSDSWARRHIPRKNKPLATMSTKFSASSLTLNQSFPNPYKTSLLGAALTRQGTSNWQLKHRGIHSLQIKCNIHGDGFNPRKMDSAVSNNFPKFSGKGSNEITNRGDYTSLGSGIMYTDIVRGKHGKGIETGCKFDIDYELYDEKRKSVCRITRNKVTLEEIDTGLREGIKGMMSQGRRLIIVPPDLADHQHENKGGYAIYDVTIKKRSS